jgi:hypothetical protein
MGGAGQEFIILHLKNIVQGDSKNEEETNQFL